jgi:hypothetical protein
MARAYLQGKFQPKNPEKYLGDPTNIVYRSSWEKRVMIGFDNHPNIIAWGSEEIVIPYFWVGDGKYHRYFPDFVVVMETKTGRKKVLIEVKPFAQTQEPKRTKGKREKTLAEEVKVYSKNVAKWIAAEAFCKERGWYFHIMTEKDIFKNGKAW